MLHTCNPALVRLKQKGGEFKAIVLKPCFTNKQKWERNSNNKKGSTTNIKRQESMCSITCVRKKNSNENTYFDFHILNIFLQLIMQINYRVFRELSGWGWGR